MKPRVLFVGHTRYDLPLPAGLARKWDALSEQLDYVVLASSGSVTRRDSRFELSRSRGEGVFESVRFYQSLPHRIRRAIKLFQPHVIVAQSPFEGLAALLVLLAAERRPRLIVEVHGDWRSAARLYGSGFRRLYAPLAERLALVALRRADGARAVGSHTGRLVEDATSRRPLAIFPTYSDIQSFGGPPRPLPPVPTVIWIGALERVKNPELLATAWPGVVARNPQAQLVVLGTGRLEPVVTQLRSAFPENVEWIPRLRPSDVARRLDEATLLALPSLSEGLPRVVIEAFSRARPVVASAVGGVPDIVVSDRNGILVPPADADAFAEALVRVLNDRELASRLGAAALADARRFQWTPAEYAVAVRRLVERVLDQGDAGSSDDANVPLRALDQGPVP